MKNFGEDVPLEAKTQCRGVFGNAWQIPPRQQARKTVQKGCLTQEVRKISKQADRLMKRTQVLIEVDVGQDYDAALGVD